jgi:ubiquinone/menaquinone biosynthesis C-methylase UbiE/uncharacterized protein YbaR (Trm112 family)
LLRRLIDILACPACGQHLKLSVYSEKEMRREGKDFPGCHNYCELLSLKIVSPDIQKDAHAYCTDCYHKEVFEGSLSCPSGHAFPINGSIPRLQDVEVGRQRTKKTFDVEWKVFKYDKKIYGHSEEEELQDFFRRMVVDESFLRGHTVLDSGCGIGRLTRSLGRLTREIVGIDFSYGVDEARLLNQEVPTVHILQGDIMNLPFKEASFDYAYSKGVLHYVPDAKKCIENLASVLKPQGGALSVTLYPKMPPFFESFNRLMRSVTVRLPIKANYCLSFLLIPFFSLAWKWSGVEERDIDRDERAHMIFNWISSEFQNRVSNGEVETWFRELGFNKIRLSDTPVGITGIKSDSVPGKGS